ncbi:MAG: HAMP domain-containing sensor histidine kinase [Candidatus Aenigmatarchaeota archaeon]
MSIRLKFSFFIFCLLVLVILGISLGIFFTQEKLLKEQFEHNREKIFKDFIYTCKEALVVKDEILVLNTIKSVIETHRPQIVYAGYISPSNVKLFYARDKDKEDEFIHRIFPVKTSSVETFHSSEKEEIYEFSQRLEDDENNYIGSIKIGFSQDYLNTQIKQAINVVIKRILNISVYAILISLVLSNILAFYLVRPIKKLTKAAVELGSGNLNVKVNIRRKDEIGRLAKTFNEMAEKLKQLDELKDSFVSSVSHELRSPLSAIDGYVDYLIEGLKSGNLSIEKQQKAFSIIKDSVNRLTVFINNILDLAKIKAGKFELHKIPTKVDEVINDIVTLFEQLAAKQQKKLKVEIEQNLPYMDADPERIKQVLTNLIGNALKFTEEGAEITVKARLVKDKTMLTGYNRKKTDVFTSKDVAGKFIEILVSDTGYGIPESELDKIFDKFYQVGGTTPKKPKGTGLGLSIAAEIVKLHNGEIGVESEFGKGSTFKFIIPIREQS